MKLNKDSSGLIDRGLAMQRLSSRLYWTESTKSSVARFLRELPEVKAVPLVEAKRIPHKESVYDSDGTLVAEYRSGWECQNCGGTGVRSYCPDCGAKMIQENINE